MVKELTVEELETLLAEAKEQKRRQNQVRKKLIKDHVKPTEDMTDLDYLMLEIVDRSTPYQAALACLHDRIKKLENKS